MDLEMEDGWNGKEGGREGGREGEQLWIRRMRQTLLVANSSLFLALTQMDMVILVVVLWKTMNRLHFYRNHLSLSPSLWFHQFLMNHRRILLRPVLLRSTINIWYLITFFL